MKHLLAPLFVCVLLHTSLVTSPGQIIVNSISDVHLWAGSSASGANRSALVIDWNNGSQNDALVWGYRWEGQATVLDMLNAIRASEPRLFFRADTATPFGFALYGVGLQNGPLRFGIHGAQDTDGGPVTPVFADQIDDMNASAATYDSPWSSLDAVAKNPGDFYEEGWLDRGYWALYLTGTDYTNSSVSISYPSQWQYAYPGISSTRLVNNSWFALSFERNFLAANPSVAVAAVPEPRVLPLVLIALVICAGFRFRTLKRAE